MGFGEKTREIPFKINVYICLDWLLGPVCVKEDDGIGTQGISGADATACCF
jgi:hypothetical protein